MPSEDFFLQYLDYTAGTEVPRFYDRWSAIGMLGAILEKQVWCKHGRNKFYPNLYILLMGASGTKKSTAIKAAKRIAKESGYRAFSAEKTSKEKFLLDLGGGDDVSKDLKDIDMLDNALWGADPETDHSPCWIAADEFNDFFGNNILEFVSNLGALWDWDGPYENKVKNGKSVIIPSPIISILGGTTQTQFAETFPPAAVGQGFFSRVIVVYARPTGLRITWPAEEDEDKKAALIKSIHEIQAKCHGELPYTTKAKRLVERIYESWKPVDDVRFAAYSNRRLTHLLKLALVHAASRCTTSIDEIDIRRANTVLHHTEQHMPDAFGDFGFSKMSSVVHKILTIIDTSEEVLDVTKLWAKVQADFDRMETYQTTLSGMIHAGKLATHGGKLLPVKRIVEEVNNEFLDYDYLLPEER